MTPYELLLSTEREIYSVLSAGFFAGKDTRLSALSEDLAREALAVPRAYVGRAFDVILRVRTRLSTPEVVLNEFAPGPPPSLRDFRPARGLS